MSIIDTYSNDIYEWDLVVANKDATLVELRELFKCSNGNELYAEGGSVGVLDNITQAFYVSFDSTGTLTDYKMGQNGTVTDLISYANQIPTTLTIVWHPVVEEVEPEPEPSPTPSSEPSTK